MQLTYVHVSQDFRSCGGTGNRLSDELFQLEPEDIHMGKVI